MYEKGILFFRGATKCRSTNDVHHDMWLFTNGNPNARNKKENLLYVYYVTETALKYGGSKEIGEVSVVGPLYFAAYRPSHFTHFAE